MSRKHKPYFSSLDEIYAAYASLFARNYRYYFNVRNVEQGGKHHSTIYQENIIVRLNEKTFTKHKLLKAFQIAMEDFVVTTKLGVNILDMQFNVGFSYYLISKHQSKEQYYFFFGHGNQNNPYVANNIRTIDGFEQLETYIDMMIAMDHLDAGRIYFHNQFPNSSVVIENVSHIVFHIQPDGEMPFITDKINMYNDLDEL